MGAKHAVSWMKVLGWGRNSMCYRWKATEAQQKWEHSGGIGRGGVKAEWLDRKGAVVVFFALDGQSKLTCRPMS